jgi:hypothetical protein
MTGDASNASKEKLPQPREADGVALACIRHQLLEQAQRFAIGRSVIVPDEWGIAAPEKPLRTRSCQ